MPRIDIHGETLHYTDEGAGEPLVFVHGSASDHRTWQYQQEQFRKHFRTIAYSRRYHWPNDPIPGNAVYAMMEHVEDLEYLLRELEAIPAYLVGHSYGAFVCLLLAMRDPTLVRALVLAEPPVITLFVSNTPKPLELLRLLVTRPRTAVAIIRLGAKGFTPAAAAAKQEKMEEAMRVFGRAVLGRQFYNQLSDARLEQVHQNAIKAEFLGSGFPPVEPRDLQHIETPALLLNGQRSPAVFHRLLDRVEELLPHTKRVRIPEASHIMHEDNSVAYHEAVLAFLERNRGIA